MILEVPPKVEAHKGSYLLINTPRNGSKKRTPSPYHLGRNLPSWLKSQKKLANMLARCSSSFHPPPCNQQDIGSKCQFFDAPLPLCPPGNSVYFPHCTGCVKPRWATCAGDLLLKKKHKEVRLTKPHLNWRTKAQGFADHHVHVLQFPAHSQQNLPQKIFATSRNRLHTWGHPLLVFGPYHSQRPGIFSTSKCFGVTK